MQERIEFCNELFLDALLRKNAVSRYVPFNARLEICIFKEYLSLDATVPCFTLKILFLSIHCHTLFYENFLKLSFRKCQ